MKMSPKYLIFFFLVLAAAQCQAGAGVKEKTQGLLQKFKNWIANKEAHFKNKVINAAKELKELEHSLKNIALNEIHASAHTFEKDLAFWKVSLPKKCYTTAQDRLIALNTASAADFFKCSNLSTAFKDVEKIASESAEIVVKVLQFCNTLLDGVNTCKPWFTAESLKCLNNYVIQVIHDVKEEIPLLKDYFRDIVKTGKDLRAQVETCLHPTKDKLHGELNNVMTTLNRCMA